MSFFLKSKQNGSTRFSNDKRRKRKLETKPLKDAEISSSEDENIFQNQDELSNESSDDLETPQDKKLRLAKVYLEEIEREERQRLEEKEVSRNVISQRLKEDHLKSIGKYENKIAHKYTGVDEVNIKILKCREQRNTITCLCVSADDNWIFSGSKDGVIIKWSLKDKKKLGVIPFVKVNVDRIVGHSSRILCMAISTDTKFLVVGDNSGMIQIWNPENLEHIHTLKGHKKPVTGIMFRQNSYTLYSSSGDKSVRVWSLDEMTFVETLFGHQDSITAIDVLHSEKPITAGGRDGTIRLWKINEESQLIFNAQPASIDTLKLINEQNFITGGDDGQLSVWSSIKKKPLCTAKNAHGCDATNQQSNWISAVTSLAHSDLIASGSQDGFIRIWKLGDRYREITILFEIPIKGFINALSFSSDGKYLIAGCGRDHRLGRWNVVKSALNAIYVIPLIKVD